MPVATAGWTDLVGILIFLIISGWVNYSRRKKAEEESQGTGAQGASAPHASRTARPSPPGGEAADRRPAPVAYDEDLDDEEEWSGSRDVEHSDRWNDHDVRETKSEEARSPESRAREARSVEDRMEALTRGKGRPDAPGGSPAAADKTRDRAAEMGKDILSKLAKELGIELPTPKPAPRPAPKPVPPPPPSASEGRAPSRLSGTSSRAGSAGPDELRARATEEARSRSLQVTHRNVVPSSSPKPGAPVGVAESPALVTAAEIANPEALRKAFILKTILDKPVSMRPPSGPGPTAT